MADGLDTIAGDRREAARLALSTVFGARPIVGLSTLKGGVSGAQIFRFQVAERPFVLRLEPPRIALAHRQRGFDCMSAAASVGAAPAVHFADAQTGVAVMDFIEGRPLSSHPGGPAGLARELGALIARVQTTPRFPWVVDESDLIQALATSLAASRLFAPGLLEPHLQGLARIRDALPWNPASFVSSHNDPNPRNLLFDGARLWLVDWELASRNDPLFDIAILTTELADTPELEAALFAGAFARAPDRADRARLVVTRLLARLFYGGIALEVFSGAPRAEPDASLTAYSPAEFRAAVADGRLTPDQIAYAFGKMSLATFIDGLAAPGFDAALSLAAQG